MKKALALSLISVLVLLINVPSSLALTSAISTAPSFGSTTSSIRPNAGVTFLCSPGVEDESGIYPGPGGGAFVEDWSTGDLLWCASGTSSLITSAPSGATGTGYVGMAGTKTSSFGLVLVLARSSPAGVWFCIGTTPSGCSIQSRFISLPSSYCGSLPTGSCAPLGIALDKKLNIYYSDFNNGVVTKCTYASGYQSCSTIETPGGNPYGIFRDSSGNIYVTDGACGGGVWENGILIAELGDVIEGVTVSSVNPTKTPHTYVAVTGICTSSKAYILDLTDGKALPTPLTTPCEIPGLTTSLQFTAFTAGNVYKTSDKA